MPLPTYIDELFPAYSPEGTILPFPQPVSASAPVLSGSAVNQSGDIVSFLPPMEDWLTGAGQVPPTAQAQAGHSCQNGGRCSCGGKCGGKQSLGQAALVMPAADELNVSPEITAHYLANASPLQVGNSSLMNCVTTAGEFLSAAARVNNDHSISLSVSELRSGSQYILANFVPTSGVGWTATNVGGSVTIPYSPGFSLDTLTLAGLASSVVAGLSASKIQAKASKQPLDNGNGDSSCPCIDHDLVCTPASGKQTDNWPWTSDHRHIQWWAPCIGSFTTDIAQCCFNHDIALWCAHSQWDFPGINATAEACVMSNVIAAAWATLSSQLSQQPWWLRGFEAAICYPLVTAWQIALDLSLFILVDAAFTGAELFMASNLTNFDGAHDCSCLCGGSDPTIQCSDATGFTHFTDCTDICQLAGGSAASHEICHKCGWYCKYDANGKPSKAFDDGSDPSRNPNGLACCPGTAQACNPSQGPPCPTCATCGWYCDCDKKTGKWYESYDVFFPGSDEDVRNTGVRCCNGQDWRNPPPRPDYNCAQFDGFPCV